MLSEVGVVAEEDDESVAPLRGEEGSWEQLADSDHENDVRLKLVDRVPESRSDDHAAQVKSRPKANNGKAIARIL